MDRDAVIERLITAQLDKLGIEPSSHRFLEAVEREFRGFGRMSDVELQQELARRGLESEPRPDPVDYDEDEDEEEDEDDAAWLLQDLRRGGEDWVSRHG